MNISEMFIEWPLGGLASLPIPILCFLGCITAAIFKKEQLAIALLISGFSSFMLGIVAFCQAKGVQVSELEKYGPLRDQIFGVVIISALIGNVVALLTAIITVVFVWKKLKRKHP
ncbi:hypothetical protein ACFL54_08455 [Planctomycetota bacterium]